MLPSCHQPCPVSNSVVLTRHAPSVQVGEDEAAGIPAVGNAREGGDTASARKCTFMELAFCLAPGLDANGISILYKSAKPALQVALQLLMQPAHHDVCSCCDCPKFCLGLGF